MEILGKLDIDVLLESVGNPVSIQDRNFRIIFQNRSHRDLTGNYAGEFCYRAYRNLDRICPGCPLESAFNDNRTHIVERILETGQGKKYLEITSSPLRNSSGEVIAGIEVVRDITESKLAELALGDSYAELHQIFNTAANGMRVIDTDFNVTKVNETFSVMSGIPVDEAVGKKCYEMFSGEMCHTPGCTLRRIMNGADRLEYEIEKEGKNGKRLPCILVATPFRGIDGKLIGIVEDFKDITERKRFEDALTAEKERLAVTLLSIGDGVITTDAHGRIDLLNKVAESLTGWTREEAAGKPLEEVFHIINEHTRDKCENPVEKVLRTGSIIALANHTLLVARDGTERVLADSGAPIRSREGEVIGVVLVFRDITRESRLQQELIQAQKLESVGILAGGIAHDFNNLLAGILGNIDLAKIYTGREHKAYKNLEKAEKIALKTKDLTHQLLTFSRGGEPVRKPVSLEKLLRDSVEFSLMGSNVDCACHIDEDLYPARVDEGQITQVINNLIINACQAMPGGGTINLVAENAAIKPETYNPLEGGRYVRISISDTGTGIPEDLQKKVFQPYFTTKGKGRGLGLATCYSIVKNHEGHMSLESREGSGSVFTIFLPACPDAVAEKIPCVKRIKKGSGRILVMDDEEIVREVLGEMLMNLGYEAEFTKDGTETISHYSDVSGKAFDAVILDLTIPGGMGGRETLRELRKTFPGIKAIASSGYSDDRTAANYEKYGFCGFLKKPFRIEELCALLDEII